MTLLEIATVIVVIAILITMIVPVVRGVLGKAERANCATNLKNLYVGGASYLQDRGEWPQIPAKDIRSPGYALMWIRAFEPYGFGRINWLCPSVQRQLKNPDYKQDKNARIDYLATPFGPNPILPHKWPTQPWFVERGDVHGDGQLVIFANGQVKSLTEIIRDRTPQRGDSFP